MLVLLAVAAGVVIVAITSNSSDDLEEQTSDLEGCCSGTEIYDIELAVAGIENEQRGYREGRGTSVVTETEIGCIPVCIWVDAQIFNSSGEDIRNGHL